MGWGLKDPWVLNSPSRLRELTLAVLSEESAESKLIIELEWVKPLVLALLGHPIGISDPLSS